MEPTSPSPSEPAFARPVRDGAAPALAAARSLSARLAGRRVIAAVVALASAAVLLLAAWLTPAEDGIGTHEQLGLPACGWVSMVDLPCPTCGMTTAFAHAADGDFAASLRSQPLGFVLAVATAMALITATYIAITGSALGGQLARLWRPRTTWLLAGAAVAAWVFKMLVHRGYL